VWFDHADGDGFAPDVALGGARRRHRLRWLQWPGFWGDTQPSRAARFVQPQQPQPPRAVDDPSALLEVGRGPRAAGGTAAAKPPPAPGSSACAATEGAADRVRNELVAEGAQPAQLIVALNSPDDPLPPKPLRSGSRPNPESSRFRADYATTGATT
jgi:hypothetical protein